MVLEYRTEGPIAYFTLNRPERHNSITPEMMELFEKELMEFMEDDNLRVGIVTGAGEKSFCAGADVNEWLPFVKQTRNCQWRIPRTILRGLSSTKPLIAAVNGGAYGGGAEIALACDFRVASEKASFSFPEPKLGILPRLGGTQRLPRLVGSGKALEIFLTGQKVDATQALEIGLVNRVAAPENLMKAAEEIARQICQMAPLSVKAIRRCVYEGSEMSLEEGLALENELGLALYDTKDYDEGRLAFKEKRTPNFRGC